MSKDRKGKGPDRIHGRAPTRPIKSSSKLEPNTPPLDASLHSTVDSASGDTVSGPVHKRVRIGSATTSSSNSAPSTPPKIKTEEPLLRSALRKVPAQQAQQQQQQQQRPAKLKDLWSFTQNVRIEQETSLVNPRQVDEEVHNTFMQTSWQEPPPLQHIRAALQYLKFNALKPDQVITSGLLRLGKAMPELLRDQTVSTMMIQMLRPEFTHSFKIRTNGQVVFLVCALLHLAWDEIDDWPTDFVMAYLEDALGERIWCAVAETKGFVGNILTAFRIDSTTEEDSEEEEKFEPVRLDERISASAVMGTIDFQQYTGSLSLRKRYRDSATRSNIKQGTLVKLWGEIPHTIGSNPSDVLIRGVTKVMTVTCRWVEVRLKAMGCMEFWLGNFVKAAKPLLRQILRLISAQETLSKEDVETWTTLLDFRYKNRAHQVETVKEELRVALIGLSGQELIRTGLKHIMSAELNPNEFKNPYHLDLMELLLQNIPDKPAVEFGQLVQGCLIDAAQYMSGATIGNLGQVPVVQTVKRWIRHLGKRSLDWNADIVVGLLKESPQLMKMGQKQEHQAQGGRTVSTLWLQLLTEIMCNVMMASAIDTKEMDDIKMSKFSIAHAHAFTLRWFQAISCVEANSTPPNEGDICKTPFGYVPMDVLRMCVSRLLFLDPPQTYTVDSTSQEFDSNLIYKVVENGLPLTEGGLMALLDIRLPPKMLLAIVGDYISRATDLSRFYADSCIVKNPDVIVKIFDLSLFHDIPNAEVQKLAKDVPLAWTQSFWTCCVIVVMLASCNLRVLALIVWDSMPVIRTLLELCISQHYSFPPPNYTSRSEPSAEHLLRLGILADQEDKECVLTWEKQALIIQGLWDSARGDRPLELSESEYVGWLMRLNFGPSQPARAPPAEVMQQLKGVNERFGLGMKLASSRDPDYLGRMVGNNDDAAWVDRLLRDVPEILNALPASTLCARHCRSIVLANSEAEGASAAAEKGVVDSNVRRKLIGYLEGVMVTNIAHAAYVNAGAASMRFQEVRDIFEFFLIRLCPSTSARSAEEADRIVQDTKMAMKALFEGELRWPNVLLQTVVKTHSTGFLWKTLQWIDDFVSAEGDAQWIAQSIDFLLSIENGGPASDQGPELSLLTIARLLTQRIFVFDWLLRDKEPLLRRLMKRVETYFAGQDSVMEDASSMKAIAHGTELAFANASKVQIELSGGSTLNTYPEILRLALLIMSVGEADKHDGSTYNRFFKASSEASPDKPKRLVDGSALLSCDPTPSNDLQLRMRIVQFCGDAEVVKAAVDGLTLVQVIDLAKGAFGVDVKVAQVIHEALLLALEKESENIVPVHLEQQACKQLLLLLQYYTDQGGLTSARALELVKSRFNAESFSSAASSALATATPTVLPNFFQMTA
ncbi:Integrator complex subunit 1 [Mortierella alpina]|nr:Integrator complex subunit 1 [Mortierella alpina]